jgi:2-methylfumaryl-CoA hydratase
MEVDMLPQKELATAVLVDLAARRQPRYGRFLEVFEPGTVFRHPRGLTIPADFALAFAATFMQANPLYLNEPYARSHGFAGLLVSPLMVLNVALSLGVQNDSEQAIAHLGYYDVQFTHPVYAGDTLRSQTEVISRRLRGRDAQGHWRPGVVRVQTRAFNQRNELVVHYERAILVPVAEPERLSESEKVEETLEATSSILSINLPEPTSRPDPSLTGAHTYFEDYTIGEILLHGNGRTITEEHIPWTYRLGNTHPLHTDRLYSQARSGPMSGEPIVYGGLVFAWLEGLASRDTSDNALWDLGYTEGYHTQPAKAGDTLYAISRVLAKTEVPGETKAGIVALQLIGVKNVTGSAALDQNGSALFLKESTKARAERIPEKLFEIERRLLIRKRDYA